MDECIFRGINTSFKFEGDGEYHGKFICTKCQMEKFNTNFNTRCAKDDCSVKIDKKK